MEDVGKKQLRNYSSVHRCFCYKMKTFSFLFFTNLTAELKSCSEVKQLHTSCSVTSLLQTKKWSVYWSELPLMAVFLASNIHLKI